MSDYLRKRNQALTQFSRELRRSMTKEERHLWYDFLKNHPLHFRRQKIFGAYIADFYCTDAKMVIELDGSQHYTQEGRQNDAIRTEYLNQFGVTVLRILNLDINSNFEGVCEYIDIQAKKRLDELRK